LQSIANVAAWNTKQEETQAELSTCKIPPQNDDVSNDSSHLASPLPACNTIVQILGPVSFGSDRHVFVLPKLSFLFEQLRHSFSVVSLLF
jgi:hypothetical protein